MPSGGILLPSARSCSREQLGWGDAPRAVHWAAYTVFQKMLMGNHKKPGWSLISERFIRENRVKLGCFVCIFKKTSGEGKTQEILLWRIWAAETAAVENAVASK